MRDEGHIVKCVLHERGPVEEQLRAAGIDVTVVPTIKLQRSELNVRGTFSRLGNLFKSLKSHMHMLRQEEPDVVFVNTIVIPLWTIVARLAGYRVVCHTHELIGDSKLLRRVMYFGLLFSNTTIAVSDACRDEILSVYPNLRSRVTVVLNPSFDIRDTLPVDEGHDNDIVILGRISPRKGQHVLLEALRTGELGPLHLNIHLCGDAFPSPAAQEYADNLFEEFRAIETAEVHIHGYVDNSAAYRLGGIVIVPSVEPDPCPLVVAEALRAGRTLIASNCGGVAQLAAGAALLIPPGDPYALSRSIHRVISDASLRSWLRQRTEQRGKMLDTETYFKTMESAICDYGSSK